MKRVTIVFTFLLGVAAFSRIVMVPKGQKQPPAVDVISAMFEVLGSLFQNTIKG